MERTAKALFITGTGTDVGKTRLAGLLVKKLLDANLRVAYFKCAMSGSTSDSEGRPVPEDALRVLEISGSAQSAESTCPYVYKTPTSPHLAARIENNPLDLAVVERSFRALCREYDYVVVEGSGGVVCPLRWDGEKILLEDIISRFKLPCLIASDAGLGTINATVLTVEYLRARSITPCGIILNRFRSRDVMMEDNLKMCEELTRVKVLTVVREDESELDLDLELLKSLFVEMKF